MRLALLLSTLFLLQPVWAESQAHHHFYPGSEENTSLHKEIKPGFYGCDIEIINDSYNDVSVFGRYDDGVPLNYFNVYSYEYAHYINLYYYGYCHTGMYLTITNNRYVIFSDYVFAGSTIHIVPSYFDKKLKVNVDRKTQSH